MKRTVIISILLAVFAGGFHHGFAQRPVGDTLQGLDSTYFYTPVTYYNNWFPDNTDDIWERISISWPNFESDHIPDCWTTAPFGATERYTFGNGKTGMQMFTDRPIKIIGIAACAFMEPWRDTTYYLRFDLYSNLILHDLYNCSKRCDALEPNLRRHFFPNVLDTSVSSRLSESLILYKLTDKGPVQLASGDWRPEQPHRYIKIPKSRSSINLDSNTYYFCYTDTVPLYEVIFDSPVVVEDSFLVAGTFRNNEMVWANVRAPFDPESFSTPMWLWERQPTRYWTVRHRNDVFSTDFTRLAWCWPDSCDYWNRFRSSQGDSIPDNQQMGFEQSLAIFPIIVPSFDTILCHQANNIRVADITDSSVTLIWDSRDPGPWELAYANINATSWDNATVLSAASPSITINGLTPGTTYIATVRTFCQPNGDFGDWCDAVDFTMLRSNAIQPNDDPDHFTHLLPNPATNRVSILSSYSLSHIDIYNLDGRQMLSQDCNGHSASLRLDDWPDGSYIVVIRSSAGSTTKKLTISH